MPNQDPLSVTVSDLRRGDRIQVILLANPVSCSYHSFLSCVCFPKKICFICCRALSPSLEWMYGSTPTIWYVVLFSKQSIHIVTAGHRFLNTSAPSIQHAGLQECPPRLSQGRPLLRSQLKASILKYWPHPLTCLLHMFDIDHCSCHMFTSGHLERGELEKC